MGCGDSASFSLEPDPRAATPHDTFMKGRTSKGGLPWRVRVDNAVSGEGQEAAAERGPHYSPQISDFLTGAGRSRKP